MAKIKKVDTTNKPNRNNQLSDDRDNNDTMHESTIENSEMNARREQEANSNAPVIDDVKKQDDIKKEVEQKEPGSEKKETPGNIDKKNRKKSKRPTSVSLLDKSELFTEKTIETTYKYSDSYNKILLLKALDEKKKYGTESDEYKFLSNHYSLDYLSYDNSFK